MEGFTILIAIVMLVFGVLQIILFFKLWGMTNNVSRIIALLEKQTGLKWFSNIHVDEPGIYKSEEELEKENKEREEARKNQVEKGEEEKARRTEEKSVTVIDTRDNSAVVTDTRDNRE